MNKKNETIFSFLCVYLVWGSTYLAIRYAVEGLPPFLLGSVRYLLAGFLLLIFNFKNWSMRIPKRDLALSALMGLLMPCFGNGLVIVAEQNISSGTAAIWMATIPIWISILNTLFFEQKRPSFFEVTGIATGFFGIVILFSSGKGSDDSFSVVLVALAALSWSIGSLVQRIAKVSIPSVQCASLQMLFGGTAMLIIALIRGEPARIIFSQLPMISIAAVMYLSLFGTVLAYSAYNWLILQVDAKKVSTTALVNPVVALILGSIIAHETFSTAKLSATLLVLIGVGFMLMRPSSVKSFFKSARR